MQNVLSVIENNLYPLISKNCVYASFCTKMDSVSLLQPLHNLSSTIFFSQQRTPRLTIHLTSSLKPLPSKRLNLSKPSTLTFALAESDSPQPLETSSKSLLLQLSVSDKNSVFWLMMSQKKNWNIVLCCVVLCCCRSVLIFQQITSSSYQVIFVSM